MSDRGRGPSGASTGAPGGVPTVAEPTSVAVGASRSPVPCNGCTACCERDVVFIHPEQGDRAEDYETVPERHPLTGQPGHRLAHKPEGGCVYLVPGVGCSIHERAPAMCRAYDCRRMVLAFESRSARERKALRKVTPKSVLTAGRKRLHTLGGAR